MEQDRDDLNAEPGRLGTGARVRVIAGRLGGRTLKAPAGDATRPTGARVKEALFSILGDVRELNVLDLYAGSGALGIEALSRGAAFAVFVESARPAQASLRENLTKLDLATAALLLPLRVETAAARLREHAPYQLVLCDPPWRDVDRARGELELLAGAGLFAPGARIVLEHGAQNPPAEVSGPSLLVSVDERRWGDTAVIVYEPAAVPGGAPAPNP